MNSPPHDKESSLTPKLTAPQHKPRPLPLFLELLRREAAAQPRLMADALKGLRAYQEAPRAPRPAPMPAVAEAYGATLRDYGGDGPPLVFVPSLINPPTVLDLAPDRSILRWLADRGHHILLVDWGTDIAARRDLSVTGHVEHILLPFIRSLPQPPMLAGYCLGGTMALFAARDVQLRGLVLIAAPWHFHRYPTVARGDLRRLWESSKDVAAGLGALPMEVLQSAFWTLDPERTVSKFAAFAAMPPDSREARTFVALEDWANDGPALPLAAAQQLFEGFFATDLPRAKGETAESDTIAEQILPSVLNFLSTTDRIVPAPSAPEFGTRIELAQGHVGMVVGRRAEESVWRPLHEWVLSVATM